MKKYIYQTLVLIGCFVSYSAFSDVCQQGDKTHIWISPRVVKEGEPVNVMAVSSSQALTELVLTLPNGEKQLLKTSANDGLPHYLSAQIDKIGDGHYQLEVKDKNETLACREISNGNNGKKESSVWNDDYEAFYSAWIERLFDSPVSENLSFPSLEPVLRNPERNFLHNYLSLNEDKGVHATPDCADFPYFYAAILHGKMVCHSVFGVVIAAQQKSLHPVLLPLFTLILSTRLRHWLPLKP